MNLQPINPSEPECFVLCSQCERMRHSDITLADLDASAGTYVCQDCAPGEYHAEYCAVDADGIQGRWWNMCSSARIDAREMGELARILRRVNP